LPEHESDSRVRTEAATLLVAAVIGVLAGLLTAAFLTLVRFAETFLWRDLAHVLPGEMSETISAVIGVLVITVGITMLFVFAGRPTENGHAERELAEEGRVDPRSFGPTAIWSVLSLASGAAVGPEAPLLDLNGQLGTFVSERLGLHRKQVRVLTYAAIAGAFGGFLGSAPVGALLAMELLAPQARLIDRRALVAGLVAGATAYVVFANTAGAVFGPIFIFPDYADPRLLDLLLATPIALLGGLIGMAFITTRVWLNRLAEPVRNRPWLAATGGALTVVAAAFVSPFLLFSGQTQVTPLLEIGLQYSALALLAAGVGKLALSAWHLSTAYVGGPIFPLLFSATCFGLAIHQLMPGISPGLAVLALMAAMVASAVPAPLSITVFLGLLAQPNLVPVIAIGAVIGYIVRVALSPVHHGPDDGQSARWDTDDQVIK
jgi:H+/Cl- antiporter ClcA